MANLTRYKNRSGKDGPVSGAIIVVPISLGAMLTNTTAAYSWSPPAGTQVEIVSINVHAPAVTSDPALTIGTTKAATDIVAAVNVTTALGDLTLKATSITSGDVLDVRVVTDTGDALAGGVAVTLTAYVSAPPTSLTDRSQNHF